MPSPYKDLNMFFSKTARKQIHSPLLVAPLLEVFAIKNEKTKVHIKDKDN